MPSRLRVSRARIAIVLLFALLGTGLAAIPGQAQTITDFLIGRLAFGAQVVGTTSGSQSVPIQPKPPATITIDSTAIVGTDAGDFSITSDTCSGHTVGTDPTSCSVEVAFSPSATGHRAAALTFTSGDSTFPVALTGTGFDVAGAPRAWGRNGDFQIGDTTSTDRSSPTAVSDLSDVVQMAGGFFHSLAVANGGRLYAWGDHSSGQVGLGTDVPSSFATPQLLATPSGVSAVSADGFQSMALDSAGQVWQWGAIPGFSRFSPQHILVPGGCELSACVNFVGIAAGVNHSLALSSTGHVYAWGSNVYGQLGDGTNTDHAGATLVPGLSNVVAISAGEFYSVALKSDGTVWSWGANSQGQLGDCGTTNSNVPVQALVDCIDSSTLTGVAAIDAGSTHTLALLNDGSAEYAGFPGTGTAVDGFTTVPGLTGTVDAVTGGAQASFFLMSDGTVMAWGDNRCGQLGIGVDHTCDSGDAHATPTSVGIRSAEAVFAGHFTNYAIVGGDIANVSLTVNDSFSPTGITEAPLDDVPAARIPQQIGQTESAPIGRTPIGRTPIGRTPIGRTPIGRTGTGTLPIGRTPIGRTPIGRTPFAELSTFALGRATLAEFPIYRAGGWPAILAQTANLKASTPQGTTFAQLWADPNVQSGSVPELDPSSPSALRLDEFNLALSPLGNVSLLALLLGNLTWDDISYPAPSDPSAPDSWCAEWALVGRNCTGTPGTADTVFEADLSGFPLDQSTLALRTVGDIDPARLNQALFPSLTLFDVQIKGTRLADIELGQIPASTRGLVVDCSLLSACSDLTLKLGDDPVYSAIRPSATFADLGSALDPISFADLELAFIPRSALPWEDIPLSDIAFEKYTQGNAEPAHLVTYTVSFDIGCDVVAGLRADVTLPQGFRYRPDSSEISDGGESFDPLPDPNVQGRHLTWKPTPDEAFCTAVLRAMRHLEISFQVMTGFDVGTFDASASVAAKTIPAVQADASEASVTVTDLEPFEGSSLGASVDTLIVGQITAPNDIDNYDFTATPSQVLSVSLSHLSRDLDLVLYAPFGSQPQPALRSTPPQEIPFGKAPLADPGPLGGVIPPEVIQDVHIDPGRPVAGISSLRGTDTEPVSTTVVTGTGGSTDYRIQVTGYNGDFGPEPYVLLVRQSDPINLPPCEPRTFPDSGTPSTDPLPNVTASDNTLFIVDKQRLEMAFGATDAGTMISDAESLAAGSIAGAHGTVVFIDSVPAVQAAFTGLDADPCSPEGNDAVVRAINDLIDGMRANPSNDFSGIRSIVIVGDDDIIPHARLLDTTGDGNERGFAGDLFFTAGASTLHSNQFTGAFGTSYFLSDAPYGAFVPLSLAGQIAYIPQVAVGRLPGDPATIHRAFQAFTASGGVANPNATTGAPTTAFVTHYDFFTDGGQKIVANLTKPGRLNPANVTQLGGNWTRDQFRNAFTTLSNAPDIVSPNAHYDQYRLLPGEGNATGNLSTVYTTQNFQADNPDLTLRIVFGIGCHAGLSLPDRLAGGVSADQARVDDWAQAYAGQGAAVLIGNLGYGYGDTATDDGFSEGVMANFADDLFTTPSVGAGLLRAQQDYFTQMASFTPYDLKAIEEVVTWGFPMYRMPGAPAASAATTSSAPSISPDPISNLPSTTIPVSPSFTKVTLPDGTAFYQADAGGQTTHGYPIVPKFVADIPAAGGGLVAHGAAPVSLSTVGTPFDEPITNTFGNATLDNSAREPAPGSEVVHPTTLQTIGTFVALNGSFRQQLVVTPGQFRPDADLTNDPRIGTIRRFRGTWLVTYGPANTTDFTGPDIRIVEAIKLGGNTAFAVDANDGSGVARVFVQALTADGTYQRVELGSPGNNGNGRWTGGMIGTPLEVFVFAFDTKGNSSSATQKGPGYLPSEPPPPPTGVTVTVERQPPRNGWYTAVDSPPLDVAVTPADFQLRVDGGPAQTGTAHVSGDGVHLVDVFAPDGSPSGSVVVAIDTTAPHVVFVTPPAGSPYGVNQQVTEDYQCIDVGSGIASCTDSNAGTKVDTARPGPHTFTVTSIDVAGNTSTSSTTYIVSGYTFTGLFQPIDNVMLNVAKAGQAVPVKWKLTDSNGEGITDPGSFVGITTTTSGACGGTGDPIEEYAAGGSGLINLGGGNWQFNWKTPASYAGQCRTLQLRLFDGTPGGKVYATAQFRFK